MTAEYLSPGPDLGDPAVASSFDEMSFWSARFGALLFEHLPLRAGVTGLDLGCGCGFPLFELAAAHGPSGRFVGADPWAAGMARAAEKRNTGRLPAVALVLADGAALPFRDEAFDLVVSNLGVNNFADPPRALAECARVARPGATLALATNVRGHVREVYDVLRAVAREAGDAGTMERLEAEEAHRTTRAGLEAQLRDAGWEPVKAVEGSFSLRYLDGGALLRHPLTRVGFLGGWRSVPGPAAEAAFMAEVEARLDAAARAAGELRVTVPTLYLQARRA